MDGLLYQKPIAKALYIQNQYSHKNYIFLIIPIGIILQIKRKEA